MNKKRLSPLRKAIEQARNAERESARTELDRLGFPWYIIQEWNEATCDAMLKKAMRHTVWSLYNKESFQLNLCEKISEAWPLKVDKSLLQLERAKACLKFAMDSVASEGHCYAFKHQMDYYLWRFKIAKDDLEAAKKALQEENLLSFDAKGNYYFSKYYFAECRFADLIKRMRKESNWFSPYPSDKAEMLTEKQYEAVKSAGRNALTLLTGLPGTGKTTTVSAIVDVFSPENVLLLAPTGKAAARLREVCDGVEASTLHSYFFNPLDPVRPKVVENQIVIIDEVSMLDVEVAGWISKGISPSCNLVLVGDPDQLPSVGPGQILDDILATNPTNHYHLSEIMRQKPGSIIESAHSIHSGKGLVQGDDAEVEVFVPSAGDFNLERITNDLWKSKEWGNGAAQYLSVLRKNGSDIINRAIKPRDEYLCGDKVIHIKNNRNLGVNNGEMGIVQARHIAGIRVRYEDKIIEYPKSLLWQLEDAYCITIHKAQGSEFEKVVMFVMPSKITTKNIIYTGLTRAKKKILIVAPSNDCIADAIQMKQVPRQTSLKYLLSERHS